MIEWKEGNLIGVNEFQVIRDTGILDGERRNKDKQEARVKDYQRITGKPIDSKAEGSFHPSLAISEGGKITFIYPLVFPGPLTEEN